MAHTKIGMLAQELANQNPWWRFATWAAGDPDLRAARSSGIDYEPDCLRDLTPGGLYVLRGPRRVGKTVATKQTIARLTQEGVPGASIVRLAVDGWTASDLRTIVQNVPLPRLPEGSRRWWFIDEITGVSGDWASVIKWLRDNYEPFRSATVVATGSSASKLTEAIGLWAGRRGDNPGVDRTLLPVGFRSFVRLVSDELPGDLPSLRLSDLHSTVAAEVFDAAIPWLSDLVQAWDLYLSYGGFPRAVAAARRGEPIPQAFTNDLFNVIFRDVFANSASSQTTTTDLVARLIDGMGSPISHRNIGDALGLSNHAVARHIDYLINGYLAWACPQKADNAWLALPKSQPKIYAVDPIVARLPHLRRTARPDVDVTSLHEMMIGVAIRRVAAEAGHEWTGDEFLFHHRTPTRKEIDFVSELLGEVAVEGKFVEGGTWKGEAATVEASAWKGLLVTRNVLDTSSDGAWAVPGGVLAYLLDS